MASESSSIVAFVLRAVVPYPDPLRRRRIRRAARSLISGGPWPGDGAQPLDIVELSLLRLLWLQRATHRAARWRSPDATALLARASIETCIAGLYWLYGDDKVDRMRGQNAKSFQRLLSFIADDDLITPRLISDVADTIGAPAELPTVRRMAEVVSEKTGQSFATDVYHRLYVPLSTFFSHPSAPALLRHVNSRDRRTDAPMHVWSPRTAAHTSDACLARLALAVAERTGRQEAPFMDYGNAHMRRSITPLAAMSGRAALTSVRWSKVVRAGRSLIALRRYYDSGEGARADYAARKARTTEAIREMLSVLDNGVPQQQRELVIEHFAELLARGDSQEHESK
jgi:hypothetical protein